MNVVDPRDAFVFGMSSLTTASALDMPIVGPLPERLQDDEDAPLIGRTLRADRGHDRLDVGVLEQDGIDRCCSGRMASKEIPSAPSVVAMSCPVSSLGKNPLGMMRKSTTMRTSVSAESPSMRGRRA